MDKKDIEALVSELRRTSYRLTSLEDVHALPSGSNGYFSGPGSDDAVKHNRDGKWYSEDSSYGVAEASWLPFTLWESGDLKERAANALQSLLDSSTSVE